MRRTLIYLGFVYSGILSATSCLATAQQESTSLRTQLVTFDIPAQSVGDALAQFAEQSGLQVVFYTDYVQGMRAPEITGRYSPDAAIAKILAGTALHADFVDSHTVIVSSSEADAGSTQKTAQAGSIAESLSGSSNSSLWERFRLAQATEGAPTRATSVEKENAEQASQTEPVQLQEVIVTAQKKSERLQDVPVPVAVLNASTLTDNGNLTLLSYFSSVPGLQIQPSADSIMNISLRGISASTLGIQVNPTVAITIDGIPFTASSSLGQGSLVPDIDPGDLARIEVLRGPQGTLYGASAVGGLINYVTVDPSTTDYSGRLEAGVSDVYNGSEPGRNFRGAINIPISSSLAVRVSAFTRRDPGYIDDPALGIDGVNASNTSGGRIAALWRLSDALTLKLAALYESSKGNGLSDINVPTAGFARTLGLGDLQQNYAPNTGKFEHITQAYNATLTAKIGGIDLTSISGYNQFHTNYLYDYTDFFADYTNHQYQTPDSLTHSSYTIKKFDQEIHLSFSWPEKADWLLGGFYTHEDSTLEAYDFAENPTIGVPVPGGVYFFEDAPSTYYEYAAFGDLTYHITHRFDVQIGARESHNNVTSGTFFNGSLVGNVATTSNLESSGNAFTYLVTPEFHVSDDTMVYARFASGYRPGGPNSVPASALCGGCVVPNKYNPDTTYNYELGAKGNFLDHRLTFDVSLYHIDWKDTQIIVSTPNGLASYYANAAQSKSQGLELSLTARPADGLTLAGWVTWGESVLTKNLPASSGLVGAPGDRLPNSTRLSGNVSLDEELPLSAKIRGFVGGEVSFVGDRLGNFQAAGAARPDFPAYTKFDLHAGAKYESWKANIYVDNVADRRGYLSSIANGGSPYAIYIIQPRTIGLNVVRMF